MTSAAKLAALFSASSLAIAAGAGQADDPILLADLLSCDNCISAHGCDDDVSRCFQDCQTRFQSSAGQLDSCVTGCNNSLSLCISLAQQECFRDRKCP